ncbi:MAG: hypothetical protein K0S33_1664 [Bacteroidetes bacterium]|jgi:hypothetical protein|nr:hypothetical protein [Bacteroidota bacterium]
MKKFVLLSTLVITAFGSTFAAVTIRYYNKDSKSHTFDVKMDGSTKEVTFDASKTSSVTIQGGGKTCIIETSCGKVEVKDGANIEIKDGCIKIN